MLYSRKMSVWLDWEVGRPSSQSHHLRVFSSPADNKAFKVGTLPPGSRGSG